VLVAVGGAQIDIDEVLGHCRAHLADFKVPQYIAIREDALPRNPAGKLLKDQIRKGTTWGKAYR
jgi:long-chain acyl-CoA synthetase